MAFSKNLIRSLFPDASNEQIQSIIEAHMESVTALQRDRDGFKADAERLQSVQEELAELKKNSISKEEHQKTLDEFDAFKNQQTEKALFEKREAAYKELLKEAGVKDNHIDFIAKEKDFEAITFDDSGSVVNAKELVESMKSRFNQYIGQVGEAGSPVPTPPGSNTMTKDQFYAKPLHEQMNFATEHPDIYQMIK